MRAVVGISCKPGLAKLDNATVLPADILFVYKKIWSAEHTQWLHCIIVQIPTRKTISLCQSIEENFTLCHFWANGRTVNVSAPETFIRNIDDCMQISSIACTETYENTQHNGDVCVYVPPVMLHNNNNDKMVAMCGGDGGGYVCGSFLAHHHDLKNVIGKSTLLCCRCYRTTNFATGVVVAGVKTFAYSIWCLFSHFHLADINSFMCVRACLRVYVCAWNFTIYHSFNHSSPSYSTIICLKYLILLCMCYEVRKLLHHCGKLERDQHVSKRKVYWIEEHTVVGNSFQLMIRFERNGM